MGVGAPAFDPPGSDPRGGVWGYSGSPSPRRADVDGVDGVDGVDEPQLFGRPTLAGWQRTLGRAVQRRTALAERSNVSAHRDSRFGRAFCSTV